MATCDMTMRNFFNVLKNVAKPAVEHTVADERGTEEWRPQIKRTQPPSGSPARKKDLDLLEDPDVASSDEGFDPYNSDVFDQRRAWGHVRRHR